MPLSRSHPVLGVRSWTGTALQRWIEAYEAAWRADDPDLGALFAPDATYSTAPYRDPVPRPRRHRRPLEL